MFDLSLGKNKKKDNWPKAENGEPVKPVFLEHISGNAIESEITLGMLEAFGIPTVCKYPNDGEFGIIMLGNAAGGINVYVPETMLEDARNILSADICEDEES